MTELSGYRPDQAPQGDSQNRLVFVDPNDRHNREFEVFAAQGPTPVRGADSPEVNEMLEDAYREAESARNDAAARTAEHGAEDAELAQAIDWNAQAIQATREHVEANGFDPSPVRQRQYKKGLDLAA